MKLHFSHLRDERFCGEKSTSYYESLNAASNIFSVFPQAKILFILRDPVERILSNYFFSLSNGLETRSPEEAFIEKTEPPRNIGVSVDPCDYYSRSDYASSIKMYWDIFGKEQVGVYLFEEMVSSRNCLEDICNFLGLPFETAYINDFQNEYSSIENRQTRTALISISILTKIRRDCMASVAELSSMIPDLNMELWSTNS